MLDDLPLIALEQVSKQFGERRVGVLGRALQRLGMSQPAAVTRAVERVDLHIRRGEVVGLVGESGCGKSTLGRIAAGLLPSSSGTVSLDGQPLHSLSPAARQAARLKVQMIFQDPYASLNPRWTVEDIIAEPLREHEILTDEPAIQARVGELLKSVGLSPLDMVKYPHQFSGGQRQRITIAMALACGPDLLIADEPTTALDVTIQQQILDLISDLVAERHMALILISHDLGVISQNVDRMMVMYGGSVVESGSTASVFSAMAHPYTRGLMRAIPPRTPCWVSTAKHR